MLDPGKELVQCCRSDALPLAIEIVEAVRLDEQIKSSLAMKV